MEGSQADEVGEVKVKSRKKSGAKKQGGKSWEEFQPPEWWQEALNGIKAMREHGPASGAPVDDKGCEKAGSDSETERKRRFHVLISGLLSTQTQDHVTHAAVGRLKEQLPGGLTPDSVLATEEDELAQIIKPVGFYTRKAMHMRKVAQACNDHHGGDIPATLSELQTLPGVGPKVSHLAMNVAWNSPVGICVDTHVHRSALLFFFFLPLLLLNVI